MAKLVAVPDHIQDDPDLYGRFKISISEALSSSMDESDWKKFAIRYGLTSHITDHPRFLRSLSWGDPDYDGHVLDLVEHLSDRNMPALLDLFERSAVQRALRKIDDELLDIWNNKADPLVTALSHSLDEVNAVKDVVDLRQYIKRIEGSLPSDPHQAIGATKELLEATMRTILDKRGVENVHKYDFPKLTNTCFAELGLTQTNPPTNKSDGHIRKISSNAKKMIETANELRNLAGTGHGHVVGKEEHLSSDDASLVASSGLILAAWLLRHAESSK
ncbi:MAG: abortive infection family protein [Oleispira sp.]|nr:abortive infection family protein [Oleispira sp.]